MHRKARDTRPLGHLEGVTVLHCDQPDCDASFHAGMVQNRGGTRLAASARGWHSAHLSETNAFRDLCPTHGSADPWPDTEDVAAAHYAACNPEPADRESGKIDP